jgi:hypothetical protein
MGKLFLPLTPAAGRSDGSPTVDATRKRLGGRASTEPGAGEVVAFRDERGHERHGVVLFVRGEDLDVWGTGDRVRRVRRARTRPVDGMVSEELVAVARDAVAFGELREGQPVRFQHAQGLGEGVLVEKCRFGGLVERGDEVVLGVGFRRLWPR